METIRVLPDDRTSHPSIRTIRPADLRNALAKGIDDFMEMPSHVVFLSLIYPIIGVVLARLTFGSSLIYLLFPLTAGFAFIGPFAAIGLYEMSRRREAGLVASWRHAFDVLHSRSIHDIIGLALVLAGIFLTWLAVAHWLYHFVGLGAPKSPAHFIADVFTTRPGITLIVMGSGIGLLFGAVVLILSAISFPMLLDRDVGAMVAVATSVRAVITNPVTMALWGLIVAALLTIGSLPFFLGLAVVMPLLGHATWHLYRCLVVPPSSPPA
ncbi:MAG: DUF2189 domain-containing protein [Xanthobacteraceae bacterium]|nr:DUF2189 domain-containing protein [Xanthobacteraceae bacterium]